MEIDREQVRQWFQHLYGHGEDIPEWHNYVTGTTDSRYPATDETARQYIPQDAATQGMYQAGRAMGMSILEALQDALKAGLSR